ALQDVLVVRVHDPPPDDAGVGGEGNGPTVGHGDEVGFGRGRSGGRGRRRGGGSRRGRGRRGRLGGRRGRRLEARDALQGWRDHLVLADREALALRGPEEDLSSAPREAG